MSIELHCPSCQKLIRAPDDAGGKHGKCPSCKQTLYIPTPVSDDDIIPLAPLDSEDEQRAEKLHEESAGYFAKVVSEQEGDTGDTESAPAGRGARASAAGEVVDLGALVTKFVVMMKESNLEEAERVVARLQKAGVRARDHVEGLFLDQMPPKIKDVPPQLVKGFLKALLDRLS
ncbi:MAG: hypothetical protein AABZ47_18700 [Planctomycetota bacterium]